MFVTTVVGRKGFALVGAAAPKASLSGGGRLVGRARDRRVMNLALEPRWLRKFVLQHMKGHRLMENGGRGTWSESVDILPESSEASDPSGLRLYSSESEIIVSVSNDDSDEESNGALGRSSGDEFSDITSSGMSSSSVYMMQAPRS